MSSDKSDHADDSAEAASDTPAPLTEPLPRKKRRRWVRRLGIVLLLFIILLGVLVGLLPTIASVSAVSSLALSVANKNLLGTIELEGLSLSWGGPLEVRGLRVLDPGGREVVRVPKTTCASGVWRLLTVTESFGEVIIESPELHVYVTTENEVTLAQAFEQREPSTSAPRTGPLPEPRGRLLIRDGAVHVSRESGPATDITGLNGELAVASLDDIAGELEMTLADGGKLVAETAIRGLVSGDALSIDGASGTFQVRTDEGIEIGPLADVAAPDLGLAAHTDLNVDAMLTDGNLQAQFTMNVADLQTRERAAVQSTPVDLSLTGQVDITPAEITARANLTGDAGQARADILFERSEQPAAVLLDTLLSAILTGESVDLPGLSVDAEASVDLAALEKAMPGLLHVRPGQQITGGKLEMTGLELRGGERPSARGLIELKDITATSGTRVARLAPISLGFDAHLEAGRGLEISRAELTSSFSRVVARGAASNLSAEFQGSLTGLKRELGQVFELDAVELAGEVTGRLELTRASDQRVDVSTHVAVDGLQYSTEGRRLDLARASLDHAGHIEMSGGTVGRLVADETKADLDGVAIARGSGWYDLRDATFHADVDVEQADVGFLTGRAEGLGVEGLRKYGGVLRLQASAERATPGGAIVSAGNLVARDMTVGGQPLVAGETRVDWTAAQLAADATDVRVESVQLKSSAAALTASTIRWQAGERLALDGRVEGTADLAQCMRAVGVVAEMEQPPAIAGRLSVNSTLSTAGDTVTVAGRGQIDQLEFGTGEQAVREEQLQFEYNAQLDQQRERITIADSRVTSTPLTAEIAGTIDEYRTRQVLALSGRYDASWRELTTLLHELAPATADMVVVTGQSSSRFEITGPANQPGAEPAFRGVDAGLEVGWTSAELYGVPVGPAKLSPGLHDGRVTLPRTGIAAATGKVNLGGIVDLQAAEPTLELRGKMALLEDITVTPELAASLLSRINPIFMHLTRASGTVHLNVQDVHLPLGEAAKTGSAGQGRLDLIEMTIRPGGLLAELLALGGLEKGIDYAVDVSGLDFVLRDGRLVYDDFTLRFTETFDLKFYGSVGLDETLDLVVSMPVGAALLERLGVRGPVAEYARVLVGSRVDVPLMGTRQKPRLDLKSVDVAPLVERAIKETSGKAVDGLLQGLLKGRQEPAQEKEPTKEQARKQPPRKEQPKKARPKARPKRRKP